MINRKLFSPVSQVAPAEDVDLKPPPGPAGPEARPQPDKGGPVV